MQSVTLAVSKSALATSTVSWVSAQLAGNTGVTLLASIRTETLTAGEGFTQSVSFPVPLKLARGSTVTVNNATAVASIDADSTITGFIVDPQ